MSTFIHNIQIKDGEYTKTIYTMVNWNSFINSNESFKLIDIIVTD